jgi:hypothetical protein
MLSGVTGRRHRGAPLALALLTVALTGPAAARSTVVIAGSAESCPAPAAVGVALEAIVGGVVVEVAASDVPMASARVADLGARYRLEAGVHARTIDDPGRDCGERARVAAIFVALTLFPPSAATPSAAPPGSGSRPVRASADVAPAGGVVAARAPAGPRRGWRGELELAPVVLFAPGGAGQAATAAGALRLRAGRDRVGLSLGAEVDGDLDRTVAPGTAVLGRYAFDLGAYAASRGRRVGVIAELGVSFAALTARGRNLGADLSSTGLEVGLRSGLGARLWLTRALGVAVGAALVVVPQSIELVAPRPLGHTPRLWLGIGLGLVTRTN